MNATERKRGREEEEHVRKEGGRERIWIVLRFVLLVFVSRTLSRMRSRRRRSIAPGIGSGQEGGRETELLQACDTCDTTNLAHKTTCH